MADGFLKPPAGFATKAIHFGQSPDQWKSACLVPPIVTATTFKQPAPPETTEYKYGRSCNPSRNTLEVCLAALDGGKHCLAFSSGMGAVTVITSILSKGDHIVSSDDYYGGTNVLFRDVISRGIDTTFTDFTDLESFEKALKPNTKMVWLETPTNPCLKVADISAIVKTAKKHGNIIVVVDNTILTSYLQRPLDFGADIVMYSLTKYMSGHTDVLMGAAILNDDELANELRYLRNSLGVVPSPFDCYLVNRSVKTLALRMEKHKETSLIIAKRLENNSSVVEVMHPGLSSHPEHELSKRQTCGHSGVVSFRHIGGLEQSRKLLQALNMFTLATSFGGYESIAGIPTIMNATSLTAEQRAKQGITDSLIRLSVGLEDAADLINDLEQAFKQVF